MVVSSSWAAKQIVESGCLADSLGLDFFLTTDHYITPNSNSSADAWAVLAALAARTERILLGTCVTPIPFRPPQQLAKVVATVDQISNGRAVLGVGAGWSKAEFDAYGTWDDDRTRMGKTIEGLKIITKLWTSSEPFDFAGKYYSSKQAILEPKPVRKPHPPLWFGGMGEYMLRRVVTKYGDAWLPPIPGIQEEEFKRVLSILHRERHGMKKSAIKVIFGGTLQEILSGLDKYTDMGCEGVMLTKTPYEELPSTMQKFVETAASYKR